MTRGRWLIVVAGVLAVSGLTGVLVFAPEDNGVLRGMCAGIGLDGPPASSPREALDAWLRDGEAVWGATDHGLWTQDDDGTERGSTYVSFTSSVAAPDVQGRHLSSVGVEKRADGTWAANGGCT